MKVLMHMVANELLLAWRHKYIHATLAVCVVIGALIRFAVPEELSLLSGVLDAAEGLGTPNHTLTLLRPPAPTASLRQAMIPAALTFDASMFGFLLGAAMIFAQKADGTARAYRVGPRGTFLFLAPKVIINVGLAWTYAALLLVITTLGHYPVIELLIMLGLAVVGFVMLGMGLSVFFDNLSAMFFPLVVVTMGLSAPLALQVGPGEVSAAMEVIPTYPLLLGLQELLLPGTTGGYTFGRALIYMSPFVLFATLFGFVAVDRRLLGEVA